VNSSHRRHLAAVASQQVVSELRSEKEGDDASLMGAVVDRVAHPSML
jgi:hypothetical protein